MVKYFLAHLLLFLPGFLLAQNYFDVDQSVKMTADVSSSTPSIIVNWVPDPRTLSYDLYRREYQHSTWGEKIGSYSADITQYVDLEVTPQTLYEYKVVKYVDGVEGYGYVLSGIERPAVHQSGKLLFLITSNTLNQITATLNEYIDVLESDGWQVSGLVLDGSLSIRGIKQSIINQYAQDPFTSIIILGDFPVPYSGDIKPDAHPDHRGAWPADLYYGDLDGNWTDTLINITQAANAINHNLPGDGKWDQSFLPSDVEVAVGRVDFSNLPTFEQDEYQLLREYLRKNMAYRTKQITIKQRAAMRNTNPWLGALGQNGIRNFSPLVGPGNITYDEWDDVFNDSYLFYYGSGGGSQTMAGGLGSSFVYARRDFKAVFTSWFGSYFGDYNFPDNYMRAVLGSGTTLSAVWAGAPHWHFHSMGMGFPLAHATTTTQNNDTIYTADYFPRGVHVNLLGDPTLKAYIVAPPTDLVVTQQGNSINLAWSASEAPVDKYYVYFRTTPRGAFELIDSTSSTTYQGPITGEELDRQYLVRASKLEVTPTGSFHNLSAGAAATITTLTNLQRYIHGEIRIYPNPSSDQVRILTNESIIKVELIDPSGQLIAVPEISINQHEAQLLLTNIPAGGYFLRIINKEGMKFVKLVVMK